MRIEQIQLKNINSLAGEWLIDLTNPMYTEGGIFAITGDTGSGKTTILDAICLALYGKTPRVDITPSTNDVMTRTTGECYAQVIFSNEKGRFLCRWSQNKARNSPDGRLQGVRQEVSKITGGVAGSPICHKLNDTRDKIVDLVGMNFDEFTRSILLAQGKFAAFLEARPEHRGEILEKLTGTEIYSTISKTVHQQAIQEKNVLEGLTKQVEGLQILDKDTLDKLKDELQAITTSEATLKSEQKKLSDFLKWCEQIERLNKSILKLQKEADDHKVADEAFAPKRQELELAKKAVEVDADYRAFENNRSTVDKLDSEIKKLDNELIPTQEKKVKNAEQLQQMAKAKLDSAEKAIEDNAPLFREVRDLDGEILGLRKNADDSKLKAADEKEKLTKAETQKKKAEKDLQDANRKISELEQWRSQHANDENLIASYGEIRTRFSTLVSKQVDISKKQEEIKEAIKKRDLVEKTFQKASQEEAKKKKSLEAAQKEYDSAVSNRDTFLSGKTISELQNELEQLRDEQLRQIQYQKFEEIRLTLKDGLPCPCCGSLEHPYVTNAKPEKSQIDGSIETLKARIKQAEKLDKDCTETKNKSDASKNEHVKANSKKDIASGELTGAKESLEKLQKDLTNLQDSYQAEGEKVLGIIAPFGYEDIPENAQACVDDLRNRREAWLEKEKAYEQAKKDRTSIQERLASTTAECSTREQAYEKRNSEYESNYALFKTKFAEREKKFGNKDPLQEEKKLKNAKEAAGKELTSKEKELQKCNTDLIGLTTKRKTNNEALNEARQDSSSLLNKLRETLKKSGFSDVADYRRACRTQEERNHLQKQDEAIKNRGIEIAANLKAKKEDLKTEQDKNLTDKPYDELKRSKADVDDRIETNAKRQGQLTEALRADEENRKRREAVQKEIDKQQAKYDEWNTLRGLIGSYDGKEFRNFVQALTFETVIGYANRQLQKMEGRYLLQPADNNGLEMMVVDSWQGGLVRSTKNLSGGERFIVSLALALGLSEMSGRQGRLESLFLDEGFGTLDNDSLNTAMRTLSDLQKSGRMIGIISHVETLKEQIATKIELIKGHDGTSKLSGPGCKRL